MESIGNMRISSSLPNLGKAGVTVASRNEVRETQPDFQLLGPKTRVPPCWDAAFGEWQSQNTKQQWMETAQLHDSNKHHSLSKSYVRARDGTGHCAQLCPFSHKVLTVASLCRCYGFHFTEKETGWGGHRSV